MATANRIKIAELDIDVEDLIEKQAELAESIRETKAATAQLILEQKNLRDQGAANSDQYKQNAETIEKNKVALNGLTQEYKANGNVLNSMAAANADNMGTIDRLNLRNKELRTSLRSLNLETEEGRKQQKEYIAEINKNTDFIKKNSDAAIQQKMNIGNYKSALEGLPGPLGAGASGFQKMSQAAKMFMANPLILVITLIVGALAALGKAFKGTEEGGDKVAKVFDQIKAVVGVVMERIQNFALGLAKVFSGEQKLKDLKGTFAGMGDEIQREVKLAGELADMMDRLEDTEIDMLAISAARRTEINKLKEAAADQNRTEAEKISLLRQAQVLIDQETSSQQKLLLTKIANELATTDEAKVLERINQLRNEGKQITLEEIGLGNATNEDRKRVNELIAQYITLEGDAAAEKKRTTSTISGLVKKQIDDEAAAVVERAKHLQNMKGETAEVIAELTAMLTDSDSLWKESLLDLHNTSLLISDETKARLEGNNQEYTDTINRRYDEEKALAQSLYDQKVALANNAFLVTSVLYDREIAKLDKKQARELALAGGNADKKAAIEEKYNREVAKIKRKAAIIDKVQALFNIGLNTAIGITSAAAKVITMPLIPWIIANGLAQAAIVAATPLPDEGGGAGMSSSVSVPGTNYSNSNSNVMAPGMPGNNDTQDRIVLVLEDFQRVADNAIMVKKAAEL